MGKTFIDSLLILIWVLTFTLVMGIAIPLLIWLFDKMIHEIDVWKELKRKNLALAIVLAAAILGSCLLIANLL